MSASPPSSSSAAPREDGENVVVVPRAVRACDMCHARKTRCNGSHPCSACTKFQLECTYEGNRRRRHAKRAYLEDIERLVVNMAQRMVEAGVALPQLSSAILAEEVGAAVHKMMVEGVGSNNSRTAASAGAMHEQRPVQPQDVNVRRSASPPQQQQQQAPTSLPPISQLVSPLAMQSPAAVALQPQHQTHYAATTSSAYLQRAPVHDIPTTRLVSSTTTPFGFYANGHGNVPAYSGTAPTMLPEQHSESLPLRDSRPYAYVASSPYSPAMQNPFGYRFSSASTHMARPHSSSHFEVHLDLIEYFMDLCYMYLPIFHVRKFMAKLQPVNRHPPFLLQCMHAAAMHYALSCGDLPRLELTADRAEKAYFTALTMVPSFLILKMLSMARGEYSMTTLMRFMSFRTCLALGFDKEDSEVLAMQTPWVELEERRRAWWLSFINNRWMSVSPQHTLLGDESSITQTQPSMEDMFQTMDHTIIIPLAYRRYHPRVPFNRMLSALSNRNVELQGMSIFIVVTWVHGHLARFLRTASSHDFAHTYLDTSVELADISRTLLDIEIAAEPTFRAFDFVDTELSSASYMAVWGSTGLNLLQLLVHVPALATSNVVHRNLYREGHFEQGLVHAGRIFHAVAWQLAQTPSMKGMPLLFCMTVYYAVLVMIAAVVREPSSPQNTSRLRDLAIGHECISLVSRMWPLMKKQSRTIARIIEQYKLVLPELDLTRGNTIRKPSGRRDGSAFEMVSFERAMSEAISDPFPILVETPSKKLNTVLQNPTPETDMHPSTTNSTERE